VFGSIEGFLGLSILLSLTSGLWIREEVASVRRARTMDVIKLSCRNSGTTIGERSIRRVECMEMSFVLMH